ncbi:cutinase family protein, partial [Mycobacterium sp. NPDC003449]
MIDIADNPLGAGRPRSDHPAAASDKIAAKYCGGQRRQPSHERINGASRYFSRVDKRMLNVHFYRVPALFGQTALMMLAAPAMLMPSASAAPCPDVEVIFARGTNESPGTGPTGQAFVDALRPQIGRQSLAVYPV